jgi:LSM domain
MYVKGIIQEDEANGVYL